MLLEVFVKFIGKPITPRGFIISLGVNCLLKVSEGKKFLTESTLLHRKAVRSNIDALPESFFLCN